MGAIKTLKRAPAHVPRERIYDFDVYGDPLALGGLHKMHHDLLHKAPPLFYTLRDGGHWMVTRRDLVEQVMRTPEVFSSSRASPHFETVVGQIRVPPQDMDPPEHLKYRLLLLKFLSPKHVRLLETRVRALIVELIDAVAAQGHCEFVSAVSVPFPVKTFLQLMEWDPTRYAEFARWAGSIISSSTPIKAVPSFLRMTFYLKSVIRAKQRNPGTDPVSMLLASDVDGQKLTPRRVLEMCNLLFLGGLDTVTQGMGYITYHLATHPEQQRRLRENPQEIPQAIDELLRRYAFVNPPRRVARDFEIDGVLLKAGDYITCDLAAASNDEAVLKGSSEVDFDRRHAPSLLAFNTGPHSCAGVHLARLELRVFLEEWLARIPAFRVRENFVPEEKSGAILTLKALQLVW